MFVRISSHMSCPKAKFIVVDLVQTHRKLPRQLNSYLIMVSAQDCSVNLDNQLTVFPYSTSVYIYGWASNSVDNKEEQIW